MDQQANTRISVRNFGPVKEGEFELKPLTIFIGPNNSGKSYMAQLVYALAQSMFQAVNIAEINNLSLDVRRKRIGDERYTELGSWLLEDSEQPMTTNVRDLLLEFLETYATQSEQIIEKLLQDYFGYDSVKSLLRSDRVEDNSSIVATCGKDNDPFLTLEIQQEYENCVVHLRRPELIYSTDTLKEVFQGLTSQRNVNKHHLGRESAEEITNESWRHFLDSTGMLNKGNYYLPSARSGILQGWQVFASMALQLVRRSAGLQRIEIPRLSGVAGDFLQTLWSELSPPRNSVSKGMQPVIEFLESKVFNGQITIGGSGIDQPLLVYETGSTQLPVQRASSMIAELAPLDLWIKYLLKPGDLLIIDEPEAHLHPEKQRLLARGLVRLVRAGVHVVCPTHSSMILHQISNLILASQLPEEVRKRAHFDLTDDDLITSDEVGVYRFDLEEDGAHIRTVEIDPEFGISEEEFVRVAESIGEESYKLSVALDKELAIG